MVVASIFYIYGFHLNENDLETLKNHNIIMNIGEKYKMVVEGGNFEIIQTPHEVRWTDYKGEEYYFGICKTIDFQSYDNNPFEIPISIMDETIETLFPHSKNTDKKTFAELLSKEPKYEVIPTDCNCCS